MVLGCRRHETQNTEEGSEEEKQDVNLSNTARNRRRLLEVSLLGLSILCVICLLDISWICYIVII